MAGSRDSPARTVGRGRRERDVLGRRGAAQGCTGPREVDLGAAAGVGADPVMLVEVQLPGVHDLPVQRRAGCQPRKACPGVGPEWCVCVGRIHRGSRAGLSNTPAQLSQVAWGCLRVALSTGRATTVAGAPREVAVQRCRSAPRGWASPRCPAAHQPRGGGGRLRARRGADGGTPAWCVAQKSRPSRSTNSTSASGFSLYHLPASVLPGRHHMYPACWDAPQALLSGLSQRSWASVRCISTGPPRPTKGSDGSGAAAHLGLGAA